MDSLYVFSGSSNRPLAEAICRHLYVPLRETRIERFSNDNIYIQLGDSVRGKDVFIVQSLGPPVSDNLLELLMMIDIARTGAAASVNAVIPYYSYARSDKKDEPRVCITARLIADLIETAGADRVIAMTLHSPQVHGFFGIPMDHLTPMSVFIQHFDMQDCESTVLVSPDHGYAKRAAQLAIALGLSVAVGNKRRVQDDQVQIDNILGRGLSKYRHAIVIDDEIATGSSIMEVVRVLRRIGLEEFTIACTHGLFTGKAPKHLRKLKGVREILTTDTVALGDKKRAKFPSYFKVLSVAPIFAQAILCNYHGRSVGELFEFWPPHARG
ncbi:MAG: ribose-phosphate diphosphokinase [Anaerolineae bacterium]|nr:ribose-phosphate diphosphokinase [Anaerolineae bacterium]